MAARGWTQDELVTGVRAGDRRALARAISLVEDRAPEAEELVRRVYPDTGRAASIGVTGPPGVGKSSLVSALVGHVRGLGRSVGVVSVDPSSPFTRGALLGDRIRLADHFLDPDVYIRSMGTRGHLGGLAEATLQALLLVDASGKDVVFLETVGTGQSEVEVIGIADVVLLVLMPGSGDSVQALKAGIMEIPDVIAINKMDHPAAGTMLQEVRSIVALDPARGAAAGDPPHGGASRRGRAGALGRARAAAPSARRSRRARRPPSAEPERRGRGAGRRPNQAARPPDDGGRSGGAGADGRGAAARGRSPHGGRGRGRARDGRGGVSERPTIDDLRAAQERLHGVARVTPVYSSETLSRVAGRPVLLKAENLQRTGAFKIRGAYNTVAQLSEEERGKGVVTASAGNHGQAVAWAARQAGIPATIFVPEAAPMAKVEAARGYGAQVELAGEGFDETLAVARTSADETGATFVHAFEDVRVIAGQGTLGLELTGQLPSGEGTVVIPVGGGGLAAGIAVALDHLRPEIRLVGVQSAACAPFAGREPSGATIADGIAVKHPGTLTGAILSDLLDDVVVVDDEEISQAIVLLLERSKLVVEGAGAAPVAAILAGRAGGDGPACAILAGGNIDATTMSSVIRYGLTASGRYLVVALLIPDRPGELTRIVATISAQRANILAIQHHREGRNIGVLETEAELTLETRGEEHSQLLIRALAEGGYTVRRLR